MEKNNLDFNSKSVFTITIPKYIRQIKLAEKQRPIYYLWDGKTIRAKNKILPVSFLKPEYRNYPNVKKGIIKPEFLLDNYKLIFAKSKREFVVIDCEHEINNLNISHSKQLMLCEWKEQSFYEAIVANPNKVNTPRYQQIRGQDFYSGLNEYLRNEIMIKIKEQYYEYLPINYVLHPQFYPLYVVCELHDTVKNIFDDTTNPFGSNWDVGNRMLPYMKAFPDALKAKGIITDDNRLFITSEQIYFVPVQSDVERKLVFHLIPDEREVIKNNPYYNGTIKNNSPEKQKFSFIKKQTDNRVNRKGHGEVTVGRIVKKDKKQ